MSSAGKPIRVGLIGFGLGGASFHAPLIAATKGMHLASVITANPERQARAEATYPGLHVASDADWLWRHAAEHDLVVISTPNRSHVPLALAALDAGLPVVIDKPFTATAEDAKRVLNAAKAKKLPVSAYHIRRWDSECLTLQELMARGALGQVLRFESRLERWRPEAKGGWKEHQPVARLLCEVFFDGNVHPDVFDRAGDDDLQSAAQPGARAGDEARVLLERAGSVDAHAFAEEVDLEFARVERNLVIARSGRNSDRTGGGSL